MYLEFNKMKMLTNYAKKKKCHLFINSIYVCIFYTIVLFKIPAERRTYNLMIRFRFVQDADNWSRLCDPSTTMAANKN